MNGTLQSMRRKEGGVMGPRRLGFGAAERVVGLRKGGRYV